MDLDPQEVVNAAKEAAERKSESRLNAWVAVTIAILATFLGVCKVKDDNICQSMQAAQAEKIDRWGYYQAKNTQQKMFEQSANLMKIQSINLTGEAKTLAISFEKKAKAEAERMKTEKEEQKKNAEDAQKLYDDKNFRDDQFDLSDTSISIAIALMAITALTQKRWLFWLAMVPTLFGVVMGLAGLLGLKLHPDFLINLLSLIGWKF